MQPPVHVMPSITSSGLGKDVSTNKTKPTLRFWEIPEFFKCPVVGMCLTLAEQKQLLKKTKISTKNTSSFEIHEAVVATSECENRISKRVDRLLQRKYGKEAAELLKLEHEAFLAHFRSADIAGNHAAALWATAIHSELPLTMKREIFGRIHMGMHWSGEERMKMNRKLACRNNELKAMHRCNKAVAQQKRALEKENDRRKHKLNQLKAALIAAQKEIERLKNMQLSGSAQGQTIEGGQEHRHLESELKTLYQCNQQQQHQITALKEQNKQLISQLRFHGKLNHRFKSEARAKVVEMAAKRHCDESCPSFDLCQKRILIVGGMSRMESLYRELIEAGGGIFEYHDGYMKKGSRQLASRLKRADLVLCPVNRNSHTACSLVKRLAKKHRKPVHMLANSSLKAVSRAIWGAPNGRQVVN